MLARQFCMLSIDECHLVALIRFAKEIEDWETLGVYLGIKKVVLKEIKKNNHQLPGSARKDMLMTWLDGGKATRAKFIEALKDMGYLRIVQEIESQNGNTKIYVCISEQYSIYKCALANDVNIIMY